jgi:NAD-dependent DNA ligase
MQKFPDDWDLKTKIDFLQRKILLNSMAYYNHDTNFLSDMEYDSISKQLVALHAEYGDISDTQYGYVFDGFDGSTGFDLYYALNDHDQAYLSKMVKYQIWRTGGGSGGRKKKAR